MINFELPYVPEDYVHRIGRTGRAGLTGEAISLMCHDEAKLLADIEKLLKRSIPRVPVGHLDQRPARHDRHERHEHAHHERREPRERPVEKPIAKAVHDGFDFSKPYEPGGSETAEAIKPAAPLRRGTVRPVAALLGGLTTPRK